jgi:soluble lytic murein transglycosylase
VKGERKRPFPLAAVAPAVAAMVAIAAACSGGSKPASAPGESPAPSPVVSQVPGVGTPAGEAPPSVALQAARELLREGRLDEARVAFEQLATGQRDAAERTEAWLGAAASAHEAGDNAGALDALREAVATAPPGSGVAERARYLAAMRLNDAGLFAEARRIAEGSGGGGVLAPYLQHELARAQAALGLAQAADATWDLLLGGPGVTDTLRGAVLRERVRVAREAGDDSVLARQLDSLIAATGDAAARYERATVAARQGEEGVFGSQLLAIVRESPSSRYATLAIADLRDAGVAIDPGDEGLVYYRRGAYQEAKRVLLPATGDPAASPGQIAFRAYYLAAAYEDSGDGENAVRYYDVAASTGAVSPFVHRARYWAARVTEDLGEASSASGRYVVLATAGPSGEFSGEAAFRAGFVLLRAGETRAALAAWEQAGAVASPRLEYWRGRALELQGDQEGARAAYQRAVDAGPYDFHGIEAAVRLGMRQPLDVAFRERDLARTVDWDAIAAWLRRFVGGDGPGSEATPACELARAGLLEVARAEVLSASEGAGAWRLLELTREAAGCGLTGAAAQLAVALRQAAGVASHEAPRDLLRVSYPVDYAGTLVAEAREAGVDPLFFAALVRQESFWDPAARSPAGALGLTQVIPPTGGGIAAALGVRPFSAADLLRPAIALKFGAYYLGGQVQRFGDPLLALAAYNAGPGNALRWAERQGETAADLVEAIDYQETRHYVMYIVEAYAHYVHAWGE